MAPTRGEHRRSCCCILIGGYYVREIAQLAQVPAGLADVVREALESLACKMDLAFIFGSVAQREERVTRDVEVFVVGSASFSSVGQCFAQTRERLSREGSPVVMPRSDFLKKCAERDRLVKRIVEKPKLFLMGTADEGLEGLLRPRKGGLILRFPVLAVAGCNVRFTR